MEETGPQELPFVAAPGNHIRLGEMLLSRQLITEEDLERALELQKERGDKLGKILVDLGFVAMRDVLAALSEQLARAPGRRSTARRRSRPKSRGCRRASCGSAGASRWRWRTRTLTLAMADPLDFETHRGGARPSPA